MPLWPCHGCAERHTVPAVLRDVSEVGTQAQERPRRVAEGRTSSAVASLLSVQRLAGNRVARSLVADLAVQRQQRGGRPHITVSGIRYALTGYTANDREVLRIARARAGPLARLLDVVPEGHRRGDRSGRRGPPDWGVLPSGVRYSLWLIPDRGSEPGVTGRVRDAPDHIRTDIHTRLDTNDLALALGAQATASPQALQSQNAGLQQRLDAFLAEVVVHELVHVDLLEREIVAARAGTSPPDAASTCRDRLLREVPIRAGAAVSRLLLTAGELRAGLPPGSAGVADAMRDLVGTNGARLTQHLVDEFTAWSLARRAFGRPLEPQRFGELYGSWFPTELLSRVRLPRESSLFRFPNLEPHRNAVAEFARALEPVALACLPAQAPAGPTP